jgi:hypothetical protein
MLSDDAYARLVALQWQLSILNDILRLVTWQPLVEARAAIVAELKGLLG